MKLLVTLLLLTIAFSGQAQNAPSVRPITAYTHADSLDLLRSVFRHSRRFARLGTFASALVVSSNTTGLVAGDYGGNRSTLRTLNITSAALYSYFLVDAIVDWRRYSRRREEEAVQRFELRQPQPLYVQRRLIMAVAQTQIRQLGKR